MKKRIGFVSNSSSSSFVIVIDETIVEKVEENLSPLSKAIFDRIKKTKYSFTSVDWIDGEYGDLFDGEVKDVIEGDITFKADLDKAITESDREDFQDWEYLSEVQNTFSKELFAALKQEDKCFYIISKTNM